MKLYYSNRPEIKIWAINKRDRSKKKDLHSLKSKRNHFDFVLPEEKYDFVIPMPSSCPFASRLAKRVAKRLGAKFCSGLKKKTSKKICGVPIEKRKSAAIENFKFSGSIRGKVLIVDDISTTGSSMMAASSVLKHAGAEETVGFVWFLNK